MKVWIVIYLEEVGHIGWPEIRGVYTSLEKAQESIKNFAKSKNIPDDELEDFIDDNFEIEKWFTDGVLRGE